MYRPYTDFIDTTTMTMSYMCSSCQKVHQRSKLVTYSSPVDYRPNDMQMVKEVPEHLLSRAFKIKHYFVGFKVVPQARWISVSDDFKIAQDANCIAKAITHRTLIKDTYNP